MLRLFAPAPDSQLSRYAGVQLLSDLSPRELKIVCALIHERRFHAGEIIFDEGDEGQAIYILLSGQVTICRQGQSEQPIATVEAGNIFGELALIDGGPRSAQARAAADCELGVMFRGDFLNLMESHAIIAGKISFQLARYYGSILRRRSAAAS